MAIEEGIVTRIEGPHAWVKTMKSSACKSCSARGGCTTLGGGKEMIVEALNNANAAVGDLVAVGFETGPLLKLTFLLYIFPICCLFIGAVIGDKIHTRIGFDPSIASLLFGMLFFIFSFIVIRVIGKRLSGKAEYKARVVQIRRRSQPTNGSTTRCPSGDGSSSE